MKTRVVHCKREAYDIYIGRPSEWGNPFSHLPGTIAKFKARNLKEAIERYRTWILTQQRLLVKVWDLKGKRLGCWCAPPGGLTADDPWVCHGQVLAFMADRLKELS